MHTLAIFVGSLVSEKSGHPVFAAVTPDVEMIMGLNDTGSNDSART